MPNSGAMSDAVEKSPGDHGSHGESLCEIQMEGEKPCGRPIHLAPAGVDKTAVCLMHSSDPDKNKAEFQEEFNRILEEAGDGLADFSHFVFQSCAFSGREFRAKALFKWTEFVPYASFYRCTFHQEADFSHATFTSSADFLTATFVEKVQFQWTTFEGDAHFDYTKFPRNLPSKTDEDPDVDSWETAATSFQYARFLVNARFLHTVFEGDVDFTEASFAWTTFLHTTFKRTNFEGVEFEAYADLRLATFDGNANFRVTRFKKGAYCYQTKFLMDLDCRAAQFGGDADFIESVFGGKADFTNAQFQQAAQFKKAQFKRDPQRDDNGPGLIFNAVKFGSAGSVSFYQTYLGRALFHNSDVSKMEFQDVEWLQRSNCKRMVYDEIVNIECPEAQALQSVAGDPNPRNYRLIDQLYHQLKKNYDERQDYWTAGDFHYGEMEVKRLGSTNHNRTLRWLHRNLGLVAWYKYGSEYGESYVRPALWLLFLLLAFTLLYPVAGLQYIHQQVSTASDNSGPAPSSNLLLTYGSPDLGLANKGPAWRSQLALVGHSALTTLYIAAFQKDLVYEPSYPWGKLLALSEVILTSILAGLFLLAVRRRFRR